MMKLALMRTTPGKEDQELPLLQRICLSSSSRHFSTSTVQKRLHESGLHGRIAAKKTLLRKNKKRIAWAKKHKELTLDQWKSVLWSCESKFANFASNRHHVGGVMVWGCFAGDTVGDLFKIPDTLNQHGYHSIMQQHAIPSGLCVVGPSFVVQQDNEPKHTSRLCEGYMTKKETDGVLRQMT
ncbi:hypothetical protein CRUP_010263 [Coryphaenoides rupestris]|nr:hypothetical protein CRUP_010263 [Coryphaenoides rupestris]